MSNKFKFVYFCSIFICFAVMFMTSVNGASKKITVGQQIDVSVSDIDSSSAPSKILTTPVLTGNGSGLNKTIKFLIYPKIKTSTTDFKAILKNKVKVIRKKDIFSNYKNGLFLNESNIQNKEISLDLKIRNLTKGDKQEYKLNINPILVPPEILRIEHEDGSLFSEKPLPGSKVVIVGKYFGGYIPKVWVEYSNESSNKIKALKCKVLKPLEYSNWKGVQGKSCMDINTGLSKIKIELPKKWPKSWNPDSINIVLFNDVGAVSETIPFLELKYSLTVNDGIGGGSYTSGLKVNIIANVPGGMIFDKWNGDTANIQDPFSIATFVTMPDRDIVLTATFKQAPQNTFAVKGTISGDIQEWVTISADTSHLAVSNLSGIYSINGLPSGSYTIIPWLDGYKFTPENRVVTITNNDAAGIDFTAIKNTDPQYLLTVNAGTGSGQYTENSSVTITATVPSGQVFDGWTGDTQYLADATLASTTVTMPAQDITVTAAFKQVPPTTHSLSGTITGDIQQGVTVAVDATHSATTDASGNYTINGLTDGNYTVTPTLTGYTFTPATASAAISGADVTGIDFIASKKYKLTVNYGLGSGFYADGAKVDIHANIPEGMTFDSWTGDITDMDDTSASDTFITMPKSDISVSANFNITNGPYSISGTITGDTVEGITVYAGYEHSAVTDVNGNYEITGLFDGTYKILPCLTYNSFNPSYMEAVISGGNVTGIDFIDSNTPQERKRLDILYGATPKLYSIGSLIKVRADIYGKQIFKEWLGDTDTMFDKNSAETYVVIPPVDLTIIAKTVTVPNGKFTLRGRITGLKTKGLQVSVDQDHYAITDKNGYFEIIGLENGIYTIVPQEIYRYYYEPATITVEVNNSDVDNLDFNSKCSWPVYYLTVNNGKPNNSFTRNLKITLYADPIPGKTFVKWSGDTDILTDITEINAKFRMPERDLTFTPLYTATIPNTYNLSGKIDGDRTHCIYIEGGSEYSTLSSFDGSYILPSLPDGTYTITPKEDGYDFTPSSQTITVNGNDISDVNFHSTKKIVTPTPLIFYPVESQECFAGNNIKVWAYCKSSDGSSIEITADNPNFIFTNNKATWQTTDTDAGDYHILLTAKDGNGNTAEQYVDVKVKSNMDMLIHRTEFEKAGDLLVDLNFDGEGDGATYAITSGNGDQFYKIDSSNGKITYNKEIPDVFDVLTEHNLTVTIDYNSTPTNHKIKVVDGFDYYVLHHPEMTMLKFDHETFKCGEWTAINNLWAKGPAVEWVDFRSVILINPKTFPQGSVILWDTPVGAPIHPRGLWGYPKITMSGGNALPVIVKNVKNINWNIKYKRLFGSNNYQVAFNMFYTTPLSNRWIGDFFMAIDSGSFYPFKHILKPDPHYLNGIPITLRYASDPTTLNAARHLKVLYPQQFTVGTFDMKDFWDYFADYDDPTGVYDKCLNEDFRVKDLMIGIENQSFGAVKFEHIECELIKK